MAIKTTERKSEEERQYPRTKRDFLGGHKFPLHKSVTDFLDYSTEGKGNTSQEKSTSTSIKKTGNQIDLVEKGG